METITPEQKQPVFKALALAGLLGIIIVIAWLAILLVQVFPTALSSLASIANSVYNYNPLKTQDLSLSQSETLVNSGVPFSMSWNDLLANGTYTFSYQCSEGATVDLTSSGDTFSELSCATEYNIGTSTNLSLTVNTAKTRYTDIVYTVSFYRPNDTAPSASHTATTTIVNQAILASAQPGINTGTATTTSPAETEVATTSTKATSTTTVTTPVVPPKSPATTSVSTTTPTLPVTVPAPTPTYTYAIPTSNQNGTIDLVLSYLGIGEIRNGVFVNSGIITEGKEGAFQFAVHNIGSKTSEDWTYTAELPGGGTYTSDEEDPLRPNERALITVSFPAIANSDREAFSVSVDTDRDANLATNSFTITSLVTN